MQVQQKESTDKAGPVKQARDRRAVLQILDKGRGKSQIRKAIGFSASIELEKEWEKQDQNIFKESKLTEDHS